MSKKSKSKAPVMLSRKQLDQLLKEAARSESLEGTPDQDERIREIFLKKVTDSTGE